MKHYKNLLLVLCFFFSTAGHTNIKIGTLMFNPPFIISVGTGFDIDLTQLLCKQLHERCELIPMNLIELYKSLQEGTIDFAIGGISISPLTNAEFIFSLPYVLNRGQFLITEDSPITSIKDLKGKIIGVRRDNLNGSVFYYYLLDNYPGFFTIKEYENANDLINALHNKEIAAAFLHRSVVNYWSIESEHAFKPMGPIVIIGDGIAIMALPKKKALIDQINTALILMEKNNTYIKLYSHYFPNE